MIPRDPVDLIDYEQLNPGVRELVQELRELLNLQTTDSGDGTNFKNGMGGAMEERHVFIQVEVDEMIDTAKELHVLYPDSHIECNWSPDSPSSSAFVMLFPDGLIIPDGYSTEKPE